MTNEEKLEMLGFLVNEIQENLINVYYRRDHTADIDKLILLHGFVRDVKAVIEDK